MTTILIKKKDTAGAPASGDLTNAAGGAEIAVNTATKRLYSKDSGGNVVELGTNPSAIDTTTVDTTNLEVTNIKAKDGTASATIADSTGVMTIGSSVLTTTDINGGAIDGTTVGAASASTGAFTTLSATGVATFSAGTAALPAITTTGDTNTGIFFPAADTIAFAEGGAEAMRIDSSGNLGLGVTPSAWNTYKAFEVGTLGTSLAGTTGQTILTNNAYYQSNWKYAATGSASFALQIGGAHQWHTAPSGTAGNAISFTQAMTLHASGGLSLGSTSDPGASTIYSNGLQVNKANLSVLISGAETDDPNISFSRYSSATGNNRGAKIQYVFTGVSAQESGGLAFYTNPSTSGSGGLTERARIDSSGNVGIGTSSPSAHLEITKSSAVVLRLNDLSTNYWDIENNSNLVFSRGGTERARIDISGNLLVGATTLPATNRTIGFAAKSNSTGGIQLYQTANNSDWAITATSGSIVNFYSDTGSGLTYAGSISVNSNVTTYGSISDYRLKENVQPMTGALANVLALNPVTYTFKNGGQASQGFIAHELQSVVPDAVTGEKDAVKEEQYEVTPAIKDEEGNTVTEAVMGTRTVPDYQGVDTSFLVATLTAAIQEQQALITSLTTRITALEST